MWSVRRNTAKTAFAAVAVLLTMAVMGCNYVVPITASPTGKVDERLLGNWYSVDGNDSMRVAAFDDSNYVACYNGELLKAYHSELGKHQFMSVQDIESKDRKYTYILWTLYDDGKTLGLRAVSADIVPEDTKDIATVQKLLQANLNNPMLFEEEERYQKR